MTHDQPLQRSPSRTRPPSGEPPPAWATAPDGRLVDLRPLARESCGRYDRQFPDERRRYGGSGHAWCVHDNLYLFLWAFEDVAGMLDLMAEVSWLARVLESRGFPLDRFVVGLEIAADVARGRLPAETGTPVSAALASAASAVAARATFR